MKVIFIGCSNISGTSKKSGNPYNFNQIRYLIESENVDTENYKHKAHGLKQFEVNVSDSVFEASSKIKPMSPAVLTVQTGQPGEKSYISEIAAA